MVNVTIYSIHGSYGYGQDHKNRLVVLDSGHHRILLARINIADQLIPSSYYEPLPQILKTRARVKFWDICDWPI